MKYFTTLVLALGCFAALTSIVGCNDNSAQPVVEDKDRTAKLTKMREFFDKVHGDYSALQGPDKEEFVKLCGSDEKKAQETWNLMKNGPGAGSTTPPQ